MKVTERAPNGHVRQYRGQADVGFKGFSEVFATDVAADPKSNTIQVELAHGPFRKLKNRWALAAEGPDSTIVDFFIDYEFKNPVLALLARANTDLAVNKIMGAFKEEADRRYG